MSSAEERAAHARHARAKSGKSRHLKTPEVRQQMLLHWLHNFHTSTRNILLQLGLTSNQLIQLSNDGIIEYTKRSWKPTHRSKVAQISCVTLTAKGRKLKNSIINPSRNSKPGLESDLSHDLQLQAYIALIKSKGQLISIVGPAIIRDGALKDSRKGFPDLPFTTRDKPWNFDALARILDQDGKERCIAFELERTPKKKLIDQQRFFDKLKDASLSDYFVIILTESETAQNHWTDRLQTWRSLGKPIENGQHDDYHLLVDQGRTIAQSFEAQHLEQVITGKKKPSGKWGSSESSNETLVRVADMQTLSQSVQSSESAVKEFIALLNDPEEPRLLPPVNIDGKEIWPDGQSFLTLSELSQLPGMDRRELSELILLVRARGTFLRNMKRQAELARQAPPPPPPPPPPGDVAAGIAGM